MSNNGTRKSCKTYPSNFLHLKKFYMVSSTFMIKFPTFPSATTKKDIKVYKNETLQLRPKNCLKRLTKIFSPFRKTLYFNLIFYKVKGLVRNSESKGCYRKQNSNQQSSCLVWMFFSDFSLPAEDGHKRELKIEACTVRFHS